MPTPLTAELLWSIPRVGAPTSGGGRVVVPVSTADLDRNTAESRLFEVFPDGREPRRLTSGPSSKPSLSPDGSRVAFLRSVDERPQVHVMSMDGGEPEVVTDFPLGVVAVRWFPDRDDLLVLAHVYDAHLDLEATAAERDRRAERRHSARVSERAVYRYWDRWLDGGEVPHVFRVDVASGEVTDLTPTSARWMRWDNTADPIADVDVSPDGTTLAWVADRSEHPHGELRFSLYLTDLVTGEERCLTPDHHGHLTRPRFSADGTRLVVGRTEDPHFYADRVRLIERDLATGDERDLTAGFDLSPTGWSFDGTDLVFEMESDARQPVWRMTPDGTADEIARDGTLTGLVVVSADRYVAVRSSITRPPELVTFGDVDLRAITDFTAEVEFDPPTVDEMRFAGARDDDVQMFVVTPPGGLDAPGPLAHLIHGGPHGAFTDAWQWRWHPAVLCGTERRAALVNFHGSTGWGQEFAASIRGEWGDMPSADVEAATDRLIDDGVADPDRIAITGGSYGGYMVSWLTSRTDRYACAVAHAAVTSLPNMYASDITSGRADAYGAEVWTDLDRVNRWSPAAHASGYATPTLVIHGERDYRVPVGQGLELYGVLRAKGVEARLVYYPDENHWILGPANSIHWYGEVRTWLERHGC